MTATESSEAVDRNPTADRMCRHLSAITLGKSAQAAKIETSGAHRVHALPTFAWVRPQSGPKAESGQLHAIKVVWEGGPVHVVKGHRDVDVPWTAKGLGMTLRGSTRLSAGFGGPHGLSPSPEHHAEPLMAPAAAQRLLELSDGAEIARWEALMLLESWVSSMSARLNRSVSAEITDGEMRAGALDREQLSETVTKVVFGEGERVGRMWSALDRVTDPESSLAVDPIHFLFTEANRSMTEGIRDKVDDPQIGPKIRRLARHLGIGTDLDALIEEYRRLYPSDRLGRARAIKALTSAPRLEATCTAMLDEEGGR